MGRQRQEHRVTSGTCVQGEMWTVAQWGEVKFLHGVIGLETKEEGVQQLLQTQMDNFVLPT